MWPTSFRFKLRSAALALVLDSLRQLRRSKIKSPARKEAASESGERSTDLECQSLLLSYCAEAHPSRWPNSSRTGLAHVQVCGGLSCNRISACAVLRCLRLSVMRKQCGPSKAKVAMVAGGSVMPMGSTRRFGGDRRAIDSTAVDLLSDLQERRSPPSALSARPARSPSALSASSA